MSIVRDAVPKSPLALNEICVIGKTAANVSVCLCNVDGTQSIGVVDLQTKNIISLQEIDAASFNTVVDMLSSPHIWDLSGRPVSEFSVSMCAYSRD